MANVRYMIFVHCAPLATSNLILKDLLLTSSTHCITYLKNIGVNRKSSFLSEPKLLING